MKEASKTDGKVITFYSYKGGTGRSMALANIAVLLAQKGKKVLMIDWDLEAPGLPKYFNNFITPNAVEKYGLIDFFIEAEKTLPHIPFEHSTEDLIDTYLEKVYSYLISLSVPGTGINLLLLKAGDEENEDYSTKISSFNWGEFFDKRPSFFSKMAAYLSAHFDYILIDSRTGHTDTGGICTMLMPDKLVLVFTPNNQSFEGISKLARKAVSYRQHSHDVRPLMIYPLPSRIELNEDMLRTKWLEKYRDNTAELFRELYDLPEISVDQYVRQIQIRHASSYAYEEKLAVIEEEMRDLNSLSKVYERFSEILTDESLLWKIGTNGLSAATKVYISYSYKDVDDMLRLLTFLKPLVRSKKIEPWTDRNMQPGDNIEDSISENIKTSELIIILVSADLLASDFFIDKELKIIMQRHQTGEARVIPIILRPCFWQETELKQLQVIPENGKPVTMWENSDAAYSNIVEYISKTISN